MTFSQAKGFKSVSQKIQADRISDELRNSLWNALDQFLWQSVFSIVG